jgi:hypothetical protein
MISPPEANSRPTSDAAPSCTDSHTAVEHNRTSPRTDYVLRQHARNGEANGVGVIKATPSRAHSEMLT